MEYEDRWEWDDTALDFIDSVPNKNPEAGWIEPIDLSMKPAKHKQNDLIPAEEKPEKKKKGQWKNELPELRPVKKISKDFHIKEDTVCKYIRQGKFKAFKVKLEATYIYLVDLESVLHYMEKKGRRK